jgi:hypothetical protein
MARDHRREAWRPVVVQFRTDKRTILVRVPAQASTLAIVIG